MVRQCAWCGAEMEPVGDPSPPDGPVSHGICAPCAARLTADLGVPVRRFLDSLDAPVLLVDVEEGGRVRVASEEALALTDRTPEEVADQLMGDVFECANATLPGGCGRTVHCSGCTIRRTVEETWHTGEPSVRTPATLRPAGPDENATIDLEISTERVGGRVLLRIDRIDRPPPPDVPPRA